MTTAATTTVSHILKYLSEYNNNILQQNMEGRQRAKKRRLDHLSWEEKVQRKKLKNRVAAQTSRDRKKAKLDQMEQALQDLFAQNTKLVNECQQLKLMNERLMAENKQFRESSSNCCCGRIDGQQQSRSVECESTNKTGSAASSDIFLLPQGVVTHSAATLPAASIRKQQSAVLLKIVLACLLYRTSLMNSTATSTLPRWSNLHRVYCKISPAIWSHVLKRQIYKCLHEFSLNDKDEDTRNQAVLEKWWGRHQSNWNPMDQMVTC